MLPGELFRAVADEVDVRALFEHQARGLNRVLQPLHAGHGAGSQGSTVHQQRIQLHPAVCGQEAAPAGIEGFVVFEQGHRSLDRVQGGSALAEQVVASLHGPKDAAGVGLQLVRGNVPGAAVDQQHRRSKGWCARHRLAREAGRRSPVCAGTVLLGLEARSGSGLVRW